VGGSDWDRVLCLERELNDETIRAIFKEWERQQEALVESLERLGLMCSLILVFQIILLLLIAAFWFLG